MCSSITRKVKKRGMLAEDVPAGVPLALYIPEKSYEALKEAQEHPERVFFSIWRDSYIPTSEKPARFQAPEATFDLKKGDVIDIVITITFEVTTVAPITKF